MRTSRVFFYSLALSIVLLFSFYVLIGYAKSYGYPGALGRAFRTGLEISVILSVANWVLDRLKDLNRRFRSTVMELGKKLPK